MTGLTGAGGPPDPPDGPGPVDVVLATEGSDTGRSRTELAATVVGVVAVVASFVGDVASPLVALLAAILYVVSRPVIERGVPLVTGLVDCWFLPHRRQTRQRLREAVEQADAGVRPHAVFLVAGGPPDAGRLLPSAPSGDHARGGEPLLVNALAAAGIAESAPSPTVLLNRWVCRAAQLLLYEQTVEDLQNEQLCADLERVPPGAAGARDLHPMLDAYRALGHWCRGERDEARLRFTAALAAQPGRRLEAEIRTNFGLFLLPSGLHAVAGDGRLELTDAERVQAREAAGELERALGLWPRRDRLERATAALDLGAAYLLLGDAQEATNLLQRAREGFELLGMEDGVAAADHNLALAAPAVQAAPAAPAPPATRGAGDPAPQGSG